MDQVGLSSGRTLGSGRRAIADQGTGRLSALSRGSAAAPAQRRLCGSQLSGAAQAMNISVKPDFTTSERRLRFECVALVLQGGGALGTYQAGISREVPSMRNL